MKNETPKKKRKRDIAHLWSDKRIMRFFRNNFDKTHYKNLRSVYLALCEIDSDFKERGEIHGFTKTVSTYTGMHKDTIRPYLKALKKAGMIGYTQTNDSEDGKFRGTEFSLYLWEDSNEDEKKENIEEVLQYCMRRTTPAVRRKTRRRENPSTGKPVDGKTVPYKNNTLVLDIYKNSSNEEDINIFLPEQSGKKPSIQERNKTFIPLASKLVGIVQSSKSIKITSSQVKSWANEIRKLSEGKGVPFERIETALDWYEDNVGGQYIPVIESGSSLKEKFTKIEDAMKRAGITPTHTKTLQVNKKTSSTPQKLIKVGFPNDTLRKAFIDNCYKPAKQLLKIEGSGDLLLLAKFLLKLCSQIEQEQEKNLSEDLKRLLPGSVSLVRQYVTWIGNQSWIDHPNMKMFDIGDGRFRAFRREQAKEDNQERDALTGRSYT